MIRGFPGGTVVKNLPANAGDIRDACSIPEPGRSPGVGTGSVLQHSFRLPWWLSGKETTCNAVDIGSIPVSR